MPIVEATIATIQRRFGKENVQVTYFPYTENLTSAIKARQIDFFISSSGLYRRVNLQGVKDLATLMSSDIKNPNRAEGSTFFVRNDSKIRSLKDAKGSVFAANHKYGFTGYQTALREVVSFSVNPEYFFKSIQFKGQDQRLILQSVLDGEADIGAVKSCLYEAMIEENPVFKGQFRVIDEKTTQGFPCVHSTRLYPNWVIATTVAADPIVSLELTRAILDMPPTRQGLFWGIGTDFSEVDGLMRDLKIGPYAILRNWTWKTFFETYKTVIIVFSTIIVGVFLHTWRCMVLIKRRTIELQMANAHELQLAREAESERIRFEKLKKTATIGQISGMLVHELRQPLGAITAFIHGLERLLENDRLTKDKLSEVFERVLAEIERVDKIVRHVREYSHSNKVKRGSLNATTLGEKVVHAFSLTSRGSSIEIIFRSDDNLLIEGNSLELEVALQNLIKNASEAASQRRVSDSAPLIEFTIERMNEWVAFRIRDNGPPVSDDILERMQTPLSSDKPEGLGLGLGITRSIVEAHLGKLIFQRLSPNGMEVNILLPIKEKPQ